jgi:endonuclease I
MYSKADNTGCNGGPGILTFYSQVCASGSSDNGDDYKEQGDQNGDGVVDKLVNAEHLWPQSYFKSALPMVADLHHLQSTFATPNGRRGNFKFCKASGSSYSTASGSKLGKNCFEPADAVKGNVARALLYFVTRYYDKNIRQGMDYKDFWTNNVPMLLAWNRQDPPDANERRRNDLIEQYQGNRNPFVDDPSLADRIGEAVFEAH